MKNELIGYEIRGNFYMDTQVSIINNGKDEGVELYNVYVIKDNSTELVSRVDNTEINRIYKYDRLSDEIYKLRIEQLEDKVEKMNNSIKSTFDVADEVITSLKSDTNRNKVRINEVAHKQHTEEARREYRNWMTPRTITPTEYVLPDYQKVFNVFISIIIMIIIICLYFK